MSNPNQPSGPKPIPPPAKASSGPKQVSGAPVQRPQGAEMLAELLQTQR